MALFPFCSRLNESDNNCVALFYLNVVWLILICLLSAYCLPSHWQIDPDKKSRMTSHLWSANTEKLPLLPWCWHESDKDSLQTSVVLWRIHVVAHPLQVFTVDRLGSNLDTVRTCRRFLSLCIVNFSHHLRLMLDIGDLRNTVLFLYVSFKLLQFLK